MKRRCSSASPRCSSSADSDTVCWDTDLNAGAVELMIALLSGHDQRLLYIPGRTIQHPATTHRGDGKTDAKDTRIIAHQARTRTDLHTVRGADQIGVDVCFLTSRCTDLICDRVLAINWLRATMLEYFPVLERALNTPRAKPRSPCCRANSPHRG